VSIFSPLTGLLRSALGVAEHGEAEAVEHSPLSTTAAAERDLDQLAHALHRAAESADRHVELLDRVAASLPALIAQLSELTGGVNAMNANATALNRQLEALVTELVPLAGAERDVSRVERLFRRRRRKEAPRAGEAQPE